MESRVVELPIQAGNVGRSALRRRASCSSLRHLPPGARKPGEPAGQAALLRSEGARGEDRPRRHRRLRRLRRRQEDHLPQPAARYGIVDIGENKKAGDGKIASGDLQGLDQSAGRMAADLHGRLADRAGLLLRSDHARRELGGDEAAVRRPAAVHRGPRGPQLRDRRDDRRAELLAHLRQRRRYRAAGAASPSACSAATSSWTRRTTPIASARSTKAPSGTPRRGRRCGPRA